mmetsp:Transcript_29325/g.49262  ORF Transcript_29325/g.49262 Transcript_29325/m.49262 type:complete len:172 (-) Transcript_29325:75-590(-)
MGWSFGIYTVFSKITKGLNILMEDDPDSEAERVRDHIENNLIAIFSNAYCSYCHKARRLAIDDLGVEPKMLDLQVKDDPINGMERVHPAHRQLTHVLRLEKECRLPQIFVKGQHIGGFEEFRRAIQSGKLTKQSLNNSFSFSFAPGSTSKHGSAYTAAPAIAPLPHWPMIA